jgi:hypothetical protein
VRPSTAGILRVFVAPATAVVILAAALLLLMTPIWTHFAMDGSGATDFFATAEMAHETSDRTVAELFTGPGTFTFLPGGYSPYTADEAAHLRDVRVVLFAFLGLAILSVGMIGWSLWRRGDPHTWRSIARGALGLIVTVVVLGVIGAFAFDTGFELFHRILFPGGNWQFSESSWLIRTYPYGFWQLSASALAILAIGGGVVVWYLARGRAKALETGARA